MQNETINSILTRYSCRSFLDKMPSNEDLELIALSATASPSGMNRQLWRIIVVKNRELIEQMDKEGVKNLSSMPDKTLYERIKSRGGKLFYNAPCMIVVPTMKANPIGAELFDCGIVAQNIALSATSLGINSLICGLIAFSFMGKMGEQFKKQLNFPPNYEIGIAVLLGYTTQISKPHQPDLNKIITIE